MDFSMSNNLIIKIDAIFRSKGAFLAELKNSLTKDSWNIYSIEKNYAGKSATCFEYSNDRIDGVKSIYVVVFFVNNKPHCLMLASDPQNFNEDKQELEDMINFTLNL
ncbi:hypothetical protein UT300005_03820 [Clostridium sp. CTA-5]